MMSANSTSMLIRRRIQHWKTSLAGISAIVCPLVSLFLPPEWAMKVLAVAAVLSGAGLISAADAKPSTMVPLALLAPILGVLMLGTGCSTFRSDQRETAADGTQRHTAIRARTFLDGKSDLAKLRASTTDKTQGMTIGSLGQESSGTNVTSLIEGVVGAAVRAAAGK